MDGLINEYIQFTIAGLKYNEVCITRKSLIDFLPARNLNEEEKCWLCFILMHTQLLPSAWVIFNEFRDFPKLKLESLIEWYHYDSDNVDFLDRNNHLRKNFVKHIKTLKKLLGRGHQKNLVKKFKSFREMITFMRARFYCQYQVIWRYISFLNSACDIASDFAFEVLFNSQQTYIKALLCTFLDKPDWAPKDVILTSQQVNVLEIFAFELFEKTKKSIPELDIFSFVDSLYLFRRVLVPNKGNRYWFGKNSKLLYENIDKCADFFRYLKWGHFYQWRERNLYPEIFSSEASEKDKSELYVRTKKLFESTLLFNA